MPLKNENQQPNASSRRKRAIAERLRPTCGRLAGQARRSWRRWHGGINSNGAKASSKNNAPRRNDEAVGDPRRKGAAGLVDRLVDILRRWRGHRGNDGGDGGAGHHPPLPPSQEPPANSRRRRVGQPRPEGHDGQILQQLMQTPKQNQRRQRPDRARATSPARRATASSPAATTLSRNAAMQNRFRLASRAIIAGAPSRNRPDDLRRGHDQADAQPDPRGVQFLGPIDDQRRADQPVADRPDRAVPNGEPSRPAALENRRSRSASSVMVF